MFKRESASTASGNDQDKRRPAEGRRSYQSLRILARVYDIVAPIVALILIIVAAGSLLFSSGPLPARVFGFLVLMVFAGVYYLLHKAAAQVIYILFDIANDVRMLAQSSIGGEE